MVAKAIRGTYRGNMIFKNGNFLGFIDFDRMEINVRLFNPCYAAMSILMHRFEQIERREWFFFLQDTLQGV